MIEFRAYYLWEWAGIDWEGHEGTPWGDANVWFDMAVGCMWGCVCVCICQNVSSCEIKICVFNSRNIPHLRKLKGKIYYNEQISSF